MFVIAICAIICGANDWVAVEAFGTAKRAWLRRFLDLSNGIPSHDTFGRVVARLDLDQLEQGFTTWFAALGRSMLNGGRDTTGQSAPEASSVAAPAVGVVLSAGAAPDSAEAR
jgi:hypothetical protein